MICNPHLDQPVVSIGPSPTTAGTATILIHGRSHTPEYMTSLVGQFGLPAMPFLAPAAAERSWYPNKFMAPRESNQPWLDQALERIDLLVNNLCDAGLKRSNIGLVGFSQGACLACEYVYRHPTRWGSLIAFTGGLIGSEATVWPTSQSLFGTPVFLGNSDIDPWVPLTRMRQTADVFRAMGAIVTERVYPGMEHLVNEDEIAEAACMLGRQMNAANGRDLIGMAS